jgi:hypothetical protein
MFSISVAVANQVKGIVISATMTIYSITGYRILKKRHELRSVSRNSYQPSAMRKLCAIRGDTSNPFIVANNIVVTTQIQCDVQVQDTVSRCVSPEVDVESISSFSSTRMLSTTSHGLNQELQGATLTTRIPKVKLEDAEAQNTLHGGRTRRHGYQATVTATSIVPEPIAYPTVLSASRPNPKRTAEGYAAALAYFQVAFLMFLALIVVWLPSSTNRMYQFVHRGSPNFALNIISAIVLPLQGAWNAVVYILTSRAQCKQAWATAVSKFTGKPPPPNPQYRTETTTNTRKTEDSETEIALEEMAKQRLQVRHSEVSSLEDGHDSEVHRNRESR